MYWSLEDEGGEGDHYWRRYIMFDWRVQMSVGHGYRENHRPREIFAPDITQDGSMDAYAEAILMDIAEMYMSDRMGEMQGGERTISACGQSVAYRYRSDHARSTLFVGTFFAAGV